MIEEVIQRINEATRLKPYYRLILVVARAGAGKTGTLQEVARRTGGQIVNVNLELSRRLLDLPERQRAIQVQRLLEDIVAETESEVVLLDDIEILFAPSLEQDPLRLLKGVSREQTVVAAWNGSTENSTLTYAAPAHPEHRRYPSNDVGVVVELRPAAVA